MADLVKKLLLRPGQQVVILNAPAGYLERLTPLPDGVDLRSRAGPAADFVQVFAKNQAELERLAPEALATLRPGAIL